MFVYCLFVISYKLLRNFEERTCQEEKGMGEAECKKKKGRILKAED